MESLINTYRLNQGNKEYILTIKTMGQTIRITCKNALDENINFSRDFTVGQLQKLDEIFYNIKTAHDALEYIDKALKEQKIGVTEEGETIQINFYVSNEGSSHNLKMTLGEGGSSSTNNHTEIVETTTTNTTSSFGMNQNLGVDPNSVYGTTITTKTTTDNLDSLLSQLNTDQNQYIDTTNTQYLTSVDNTNDYLQNLQLDSNINQYVETYDATPQYTTGLEDLTAQYTTGVADYGINYNDTYVQYDTTNQYNTYDTTNQYNTYDTTNQYTTYDTTNQFSTYETTNQNNYDTFGSTDNNNNNYVNTVTTTQTVETKNIEPKDESDTKPSVTPVDDNQNNAVNIHRYEKTITTTKTTNVHNVGDEKINKLVGDTHSLKNEHQLIQDKLNLLTGIVTEYKTKLELMEKEKAENEINTLRAENKAIKQQLSELNNLRNDAAEVRVLRSQLAQLEPLRKKASEMDALRGQLNELNSLRTKAAELSAVKAQLGELNKLRAQVSQMNVLKQQLNELNALKVKLAELNRLKSQLGELNNLKTQVTQINILKKQINELSNLKDNSIDAEKLKKRLAELEAIKLKYEQEIRSLREANITEQTKLIEFQRMTTEQRMRSGMSGMDSRQLLIDDQPQQICVKGDIIHNTDELELLTRKMNKSNQRLTLNLLYKATADSDQASVFHAKCDEARSTLVLVETDKGRRFGGFTTCSWYGDCIDKKDEDAFVFSLDKMMIYENIPGEDAIGCYPKFGPIFLGCQIRIYDNAFTKGGTTYEKGLNYNTEEDYELTGGERSFNVREIEVYEVIPQ